MMKMLLAAVLCRGVMPLLFPFRSMMRRPFFDVSFGAGSLAETFVRCALTMTDLGDTNSEGL